jgi:hypothetical protein
MAVLASILRNRLHLICSLHLGDSRAIWRLRKRGVSITWCTCKITRLCRETGGCAAEITATTTHSLRTLDEDNITTTHGLVLLLFHPSRFTELFTAQGYHLRRFLRWRYAMAEAMAAAGLASNIISFIDASLKLASICKEFYENCGQLPKELAKCQKLVDEFYLWISDLQRCLSVQAPSIAPTRADIALQNVITSCVEECQCFQELLASLLPVVKASSRVPARLIALKSAIAIMHKEGKIKRLQQSLEGLKNDLRLCIGERTMRLSGQALYTQATYLIS